MQLFKNYIKYCLAPSIKNYIVKNDTTMSSTAINMGQNYEHFFYIVQFTKTQVTFTSFFINLFTSNLIQFQVYEVSLPWKSICDMNVNLQLQQTLQFVAFISLYFFFYIHWNCSIHLNYHLWAVILQYKNPYTNLINVQYSLLCQK